MDGGMDTIDLLVSRARENEGFYVIQSGFGEQGAFFRKNGLDGIEEGGILLHWRVRIHEFLNGTNDFTVYDTIGTRSLYDVRQCLSQDGNASRSG